MLLCVQALVCGLTSGPRRAPCTNGSSTLIDSASRRRQQQNGQQWHCVVRTGMGLNIRISSIVDWSYQRLWKCISAQSECDCFLSMLMCLVSAGFAFPGFNDVGTTACARTRQPAADEASGHNPRPRPGGSLLSIAPIHTLGLSRSLVTSQVQVTPDASTLHSSALHASSPHASSLHASPPARRLRCARKDSATPDCSLRECEGKGGVHVNL